MTEIEKIKKVIAELGINQITMCGEIGINYTTWWRISSGKTKNPSYAIIVMIMDYVGLLK